MRAFTIVVLSLTGCAITPGTHGDDAVHDGDDDGDGDGSNGDEISPRADGAYQMRSSYDVTASAVLPEPAYDMVGTLNDFSTAPAHTLFDLAEAAGVPVVADLRAALPSALESRLEGWIDDQIQAITINGVPVTQLAAEIAALGETTLTQFAINSELVIDGDAATHRLTKLDFTPAGVDVTIALDDLPADIASASTSARCERTTLTLGDHAFALPFGQYAWRALEAGVIEQYGQSPRALLGAAVNCPAVANAVATKCVFTVCVGHRAELTELCERGLDEVVAVAKRKIEAVRFDAIHLARGTATLVDANSDGTAERLDSGIWTAEINASQGLRPVPATFTANR